MRFWTANKWSENKKVELVVRGPEDEQSTYYSKIKKLQAAKTYDEVNDFVKNTKRKIFK